MGKIQLALKLGPWVIIALLGLLCWHYRGKINALELDAQVQQTQYQKNVAEAEAKARNSERAAQQAATKAADEYQRGVSESEQTITQLQRDLADGHIRLRHEQAATASCSVSKSASDKRAATAEGYAIISQRRVEDALARAKRADDMANQLNALIDIIRPWQGK